MESRRKSFTYGFVVLLLFFSLAALLIWLERPTGTVVGAVLDEQGEALAGAKVYLEDYPFSRSVFTNEQGQFSFTQVPVGSYQVRVKKRGFNWKYLYDQKVAEAKTTQVKELKVEPISPRFYVDFWDSTKLPGEKLALSLYGAKVPKVEFQAYRVDLIEYLKEGRRLSQVREQDQAVPASPSLQEVARWDYTVAEKLVPEFDLKVPLKEDEQDWAFKKGFYVIQASAKSLDGKQQFIRKVFLNRTDLGALLKSDDQKVLVLSALLPEATPLGEVSTWIFPENGAAVNLKTNEQGLLEIPQSALQNPDSSLPSGPLPLIVLKRGASFAYLAVSRPSDWSQPGVGYVVDEAKAVPNLFTMVYTERPLYRPGQEVFFKGISRQLQADGSYQTMPLPNAEVRVETPRSDVMEEVSLAVSETGSFTGSFPLGEEADLGHYRLITELGGREYTHYFKVEEYRKPEFKVEVTPSQERYFSGDPITFQLNAQYFFGAPVEAKVAWSLYRTAYFYMPLGEGLLPDYWGDYGDYGGGGYGEFLQEGELNTDAQGQAQVTYSSAESTEDYRYSLRVRAQDLSDRNVENEGSVIVTAGDFFFRTDRDQFLAFPNQPFPLKILTRNYEDQPVAVDYRLEVKRRRWNKLTDRYQYKRVAQRSGQTNEQGQATAEIQVKQGGFYELLLQGKDSAGRKVAFTDYLWVSGSAEDSEDFGLQNRVKVVAQKKRFQAGETGKFLLVGPKKNAPVLFTIEGQQLYDYRLVTLEGFSKEIEIQFKKDWEPNIFLSATALDKKDFFSDWAEVQVSPESHFLKVAVSAGQKEYQPGEKASYQVKIQDSQGKPVATEFSLGVVDEKIYALQADRTNIKDFFWGARPNQVNTRDSLSSYYSGGITKEDRNLLRRNFKDTAFWAAHLKTNEAGEAQVHLALPDNLTTWRATVLAATEKADVGQGIHKVIANKPLMAQIAAPRFFREGDEVVLKALLHNHTDEPQELSLDFDLEGGLVWHQFAGNKQQHLTVPAKSSATVDLSVKAKEPGQAKIMLLAKSKLQTGQTPVQDGVELAIPILPFAVTEHQYAQGKLLPQADSSPSMAQLDLQLPPGAKAEQSQWHLSLDTTLVGQLIGSLDYLLKYPYGCVEQTMSRLLPALQIQSLARELNSPVPQLEKKLPTILKRGFRRLERMQNYQGGWGWWGDGETDAFMTAYALYGLLKAQSMSEQLPVKLNQRVLQEGQEALGKLLQAKRKPEANYFLGEAGTQAFVKYVAALAGLKPKLQEHSSTQDPLVLALTALTYLEKGQGNTAEALILSLGQLAQCEGTGQEVRCFLAKLNSKEWRERSLITNAWGLKALVEASRQGLSTDLNLQTGLVESLLAARRGGRWSQTLATAVVLEALSDYARQQPGSQAGIEARLNLLGGPDHERRTPIAKIDTDSPHWEKVLTNLPLSTGNNKLLLSALGSHPLYWQSNFETLLPALDQPAQSQGISMKREYFKLKRAKDNAGPEFVAEPIKENPKIGETLGVRLTLTSDQDLYYVILEDPKPSGMEVLPEIRFDEKAEYVSHQNIRDEKVSFFRDYLKAGTHVFNYGLIPELAGKFHNLPPSAEEMYHPETRSRGVSEVLEVGK